MSVSLKQKSRYKTKLSSSKISVAVLAPALLLAQSPPPDPVSWLVPLMSPVWRTDDIRTLAHPPRALSTFVFVTREEGDLSRKK